MEYALPQNHVGAKYKRGTLVQNTKPPGACNCGKVDKELGMSRSCCCHQAVTATNWVRMSVPDLGNSQGNDPGQEEEICPPRILQTCQDAHLGTDGDPRPFKNKITTRRNMPKNTSPRKTKKRETKMGENVCSVSLSTGIMSFWAVLSCCFTTTKPESRQC